MPMTNPKVRITFTDENCVVLDQLLVSLTEQQLETLKALKVDVTPGRVAAEIVETIGLYYETDGEGDDIDES